MFETRPWKINSDVFTICSNETWATELASEQTVKQRTRIIQSRHILMTALFYTEFVNLRRRQQMQPAGCDISRDGIRLDASEKWFPALFQNSEETFSTICLLGGYYLNRR